MDRLGTSCCFWDILTPFVKSKVVVDFGSTYPALSKVTAFLSRAQPCKITCILIVMAVPARMDGTFKNTMGSESGATADGPEDVLRLGSVNQDEIACRSGNQGGASNEKKRGVFVV